MSYPVLRENPDMNLVMKALENHQKRLCQLEFNISKLLCPNVIHVQPPSFGCVTIPLDIYYVLTPASMTVSILPFSFTTDAKHGLYVTIPGIQLPDNGVLRKFPYFLLTGSTRSECVLTVDTSGGGCQIGLFRDINANPMNASTSYSLDYILSFSFLLF